MKLSRAAMYAVMAAVQLSDDPSAPPVPCRQMAEAAKMPERFLLQVLRMMVNAGLLVSTRGVVGGYRLARPAHEISLLEIVEATQGPLKAEPLDLPELSQELSARLGALLAAAVEEHRRRLARVTLHELSRAA
ncbi:MAG: Rrf2 family transcriptional regulator [Pirellulales bacterium]|nr:Rrf2 family transcriptional regulator [Pirellulales bacterium]